MSHHLLELLGAYGAAVVIGFVAGMFPLVSIEAFLIGYVALVRVTWPELALLVLLGALGHQIAKTVCYFAGTNTLEHRRIAPSLERWRPRLERWNRYPWLMFVLAATVGIPPMWLIGFIARPIMHLRFLPFTLVGFAGRIARYATLAVIPMLASR